MQAFLELIGYQDISLPQVAVKMLLAAICGGILGYERTRKRRAAGIRTYSMVCVGGAIVMMTGIALQQRIGGDPARLGAQVVSGIGFIGAGAIIVTGYHEIKGLTTAAGLWVTACMGLAIGAGYYFAAILGCAILYCTMFFGAKMQDRVISHTNRLRVLVFFYEDANVTDFMSRAKDNDIFVNDCESVTSGEGTKTGMIFSLKLPNHWSHEKAIEVMTECPGVYFIEKIG